MASTRTVVAVDVGGTETKAALVSGRPAAAVPLAEHRRPTPRRADSGTTVAAVVDLVLYLVEELRREGGREVEAVGVVVPGVVDEERGVGVYSANLGWRDAPFAELLTARTGLPTAFGHDVRAGGLAELRLGAARGHRDALIMPIGTGIAAAIVVGGRVHSAGGYAGELGHIDIGHGEPCGCGQRGCLERVASSAAIARRYTRRSGREVRGAVDVAEAVRAGDQDAVAVWEEAVTALGKALVLACTILGPEVVVLGGGLALARELLTEPLGRRLNELMTFQRPPELRLAELGDGAGRLGAALLALDLLEAR
ncbi:ROK family protein [Longimycelium tulufanense]|uniref:ROK family protein n=1 Tax=Longimycelium tulufanense TaxID=907463 RepID=UPI001E3C5A64|nr:ROK family protein [Longimycelium tulufanense]